MKLYMPRIIKSFAEATKASVLVEAALILPVMVMLFVGIIETSRLIMFTMRVDKAAHGIASFLGDDQQEIAGLGYTGQNLYDIGRAFLYPLDFYANIGFAYFGKPLGQRQNTNGGQCVNNEICMYRMCSYRIHSDGTTVTLSTPGEQDVSIVPISGQDYMIMHMDVGYEPLLDISGNIIPIFQPRDIKRHAVYTPRRGEFLQLSNTFCNQIAIAATLPAN